MWRSEAEAHPNAGCESQRCRWAWELFKCHFKVIKRYSLKNALRFKSSGKEEREIKTRAGTLPSTSGSPGPRFSSSARDCEKD